ncbi:autoinducer binding domain-containing protein [Histidinibacterium lentulum]|uniref:Transcriptional regulator n=1 Tax=Histidinibacterium lentulum TaxID=2480588 RepID=A0A3N2R4N3_9RHOB|nr:autoinducer binding domain-containing protein [Histidinibacterium lentulum]ROU02367.1 transcriptional regulator [Histidinibacterium lentulum]
MSSRSEIDRYLTQLGALSPSGFAMAFHIRYTTPAFLFQTYDRRWLDLYSQKGLVMQDPIVSFGFTQTGWRRWSDLDDPAGVLAQSADFGLAYGLAVAIDEGGSRSVAGLARPDREFDDREIAELVRTVTDLHLITLQAGQLSAEAHDELKRMSVALTHPAARPT